MLFIIASLSKNQLYQFNQIKKVPTIQARRYRSFPNISVRHFTIV